jgi:hypothetical protein
MGRACHDCFNTRPKMFKCGLCRTAHYCSKECQMSHWLLHKVICDRGGESRSQASSQRHDETIQLAISSPPHATHVSVHTLASDAGCGI